MFLSAAGWGILTKFATKPGKKPKRLLSSPPTTTISLPRSQFISVNMAITTICHLTRKCYNI